MGLKEIIGLWLATLRCSVARARSRVELQKVVVEIVVQLHDGSLVPTSVAVIRNAEHGNHIAIVRPVVSVGENAAI